MSPEDGDRGSLLVTDEASSLPLTDIFICIITASHVAGMLMHGKHILAINCMSLLSIDPLLFYHPS